MKDAPILYFLAFFNHVRNTNLGTEFESVCLFHKYISVCVQYIGGSSVHHGNIMSTTEDILS